MRCLHKSQKFSAQKGKRNIERGECKLGAKLGSKLGCKSFFGPRFASQLGEIGQLRVSNLIKVGTQVGAQVGTKLGYREPPYWKSMATDANLHNLQEEIYKYCSVTVVKNWILWERETVSKFFFSTCTIVVPYRMTQVTFEKVDWLWLLCDWAGLATFGNSHLSLNRRSNKEKRLQFRF